MSNSGLQIRWDWQKSELLTELNHYLVIHYADLTVQSLAIRWALSSVNSSLAPRGSQQVGLTQPRTHLIAHPCTVFLV